MTGAPPCSLAATSGRLQATLALDEDVSRLRYVSGTREAALRRLGLDRVRDLLAHIPRRYLDFSRALSIEEAPIGEVSTVRARVERVRSRRTRSRISLVEVLVTDGTCPMVAAFFRQPWVADQLACGDAVALMGKVEFSFGFKRMVSPHFEKLSDDESAGRILPVHPVGEGVSSAWMRRICATALAATSGVLDFLPAPLRVERRLMALGAALRALHFPRSMAERELARRRLAYDELLCLQLALRLRNDVDLLGIAPHAHVVGGPALSALEAALPFVLSAEQRAAADDILRDMGDGSHVMNRLLLGDVGTGKTVVACLAIAVAADSGTQAAVMAPTGVLAQQYAHKAGPLLERAGVRWALVTGSTPAAERAETARLLAAGGIDVVFGTQALLSDDIAFHDLSLVVIDEQHRFGVGQRNALRAKGPGADLLVMTATPIPRTLALSVYGDLDVSAIAHRPVPGAGVETRVLAESCRDVAWGALRDAVASGRQAYVICPLVEEGEVAQGLDALGPDPEEGSPLRDVAREAEEVSRAVPAARVGVLHGRMRPRDKDEAIRAFREGEVDILVSTTVVEVGVDVPNATIMVVENGDRFGLATLHQLRGRVGRGELAGTCYIMAGSAKGERGEAAARRLGALERTSDGFELSEMDLRLRHEGEILGFRQSGGVTLRFCDLSSDSDIVGAAHADAEALLARSAHLDDARLAPLRLEVVDRYGDVFKEVSGG